MSEQYPLKEIQQIDKALMVAFIEVTKKLNLNYYLLGGTLLGAVRHKGFIPWDDDVDVGMLRKDYELFLEKAPDLLPSFYFLQSWRSDPEYPRISAKLRDSRTTFIEYNVKDLNINHGVFIDIFPLDYYPENKIAQLIFEIQNKCLKARSLKEFSIPETRKHPPLVELIIKVIQIIMTIKYPTLEITMAARDRLYTSVQKSGLIANHGGAWGKKETVPAEWYGQGLKGSFEGIEVTLPVMYDRWLSKVYGNYLQLPPLEKRVSHHDLKLIDINTPYKKYTSKQEKPRNIV